MDDLQAPSTLEAQTTHEYGSGFVFWGLLSLALAGFVPCVLLPCWRDYQAICLAERCEQREVLALQSNVERQERHLRAIRTDPAVAARLAQRELSYSRPGETQVRLQMPVSCRLQSDAPQLEGWTPPAQVSRLAEMMPRADYDAIFCREPTRTITMVLSGVVLLAAFMPGVGYPAKFR